MRWSVLFASFVLASVVPTGAYAAQCSAASVEQRVALLELYTSEGCDSCPPADNWVSGLAARGLLPHRLVVLSFHVDYWNHLGWPDPFAQRKFTERQQDASARNRARFVYTPQLLLDGKDYRRGTLRDDLPERIATLNQRSPGASVKLDIEMAGTSAVAVNASVLVAVAQKSTARTYLALYENNLATNVTRGENRGRQLRHDFVVRELAGPFQSIPGKAVEVRHTFRLASAWKTKDLHIGAFVQDSTSGEILQALARQACS
jgi:hypothetical protein